MDRLAELKDALGYNRRTGQFHWKVRKNSYGGSIEPGDAAGTSKDGYIQIGFTHSDGKRRLYRAHRLAWWFETGEMPRELDHKNGDRSDNRLANLRSVTRTQNNHNPNNRLRSDNKSGHPGVSWRADTKKWHARIKIEGRPILLGDYVELKDAIAVREAAERKYKTGVF